MTQQNQEHETVVIRSRAEIGWDADHYFGAGVYIFIPLHLLDSVSKAILELMEWASHDYEYSITEGILEFVLASYDGGCVIEKAGKLENEGIGEALSELNGFREEIMQLLDLPDNDEWSIALGVNGCY
jgi:hypothetical protein